MWIDVQRRRFRVADFGDFDATFPVEKGVISTPVVEILWRPGPPPLPI